MITKVIHIKIIDEDPEMTNADVEDLTEFFIGMLNDEFYKEGLTFEPIDDKEYIPYHTVKKALFKIQEYYTQRKMGLTSGNQLAEIYGALHAIHKLKKELL